jgi:hypothetical protein
LLLAILSLDAYNRGYGAGLADGGSNDPDGLGETGRIGPATLINPIAVGRTQTVLNDWQSAGFYAIAYKLDTKVGDLDAGSTIISYRGTNNTSFNRWQTKNDIFTGWVSATGKLTAQSLLALDFYDAVNSQKTVSTVTGSSLGGSLTQGPAAG